LRSVHFATDRGDSTNGLVLVGWSLGGVAAAGLTIHAPRLNVRVAQTVCLAGAFTARDPISGERLGTELPSGRDRSPFVLLHGVADDVVPVAVSRAFTAALKQNGWSVELVELATDHGAIAGATYDSAADRYSPAHGAGTLAVATEVAALIAAVLQRRTAP
jgi:dienelactone hydrolase